MSRPQRESGLTWPRRDQNAARVQGPDLVNRLLVILQHDVLAAQIAQILAQIVREAVVVIHKHDGPSSRAAVSCTFGGDSKGMISVSKSFLGHLAKGDPIL